MKRRRTEVVYAPPSVAIAPPSAGATLQVADLDLHVRTIAALVQILEVVERKLVEVRRQDAQPEHAAAHGHLRTALTYERKVLAALTDPKGMCALTHATLREATAIPVAQSIALLTVNPQTRGAA